MSEKIEQLEEQVAELEQQVENLFEQLAESKELIAEEALLAGYELGYLQAVVNRTEKELFVQQASASFDQVMAAPEMLDKESLTDLLEEIDTIDDIFVSDIEQEEEAQVEAKAEKIAPVVIEEELLSDQEDTAPAEEFTQSEVNAAVRNWLNHVDEPVKKDVKVEQRQEEFELV